MPYYLHRYNRWGSPWYAGVFAEAPGWSPDGTGTPPVPPTVDDVDAYFSTSFGGAAWEALTPEEQQVALAEATKWLGTLCWDPGADCCGKSFDDAWLMATSELALALHRNQQAVIPDQLSSLPPGLYTKRQKLGALEQEFAQFNPLDGGSGKVTSKAPILLQRFPWLYDILGCWLETPVGSVIRDIPVVRN